MWRKINVEQESKHIVPLH